MNLFVLILNFLKTEMIEPQAFGWFHILWIVLAIIFIFILYKIRNNYSEKQLKMVLGIYGIVALILELLKQLIWSVSFDSVNNVLIWDYSWYSFPFQLCTTPIYVCIICLFLKKGKLRNNLLSYIAFITILGSISTILLPDSCLTSDVLINIHTMWLHFGSFVVSIYLLMSKEIKLDLQTLKKSFYVFLFFVGIAFFMNIILYNIGILHGETFNMFYISPYFMTELPVFSFFQQNLPYILYLFVYIFSLMLGGFIIYIIAKFIDYIYNKMHKID